MVRSPLDRLCHLSDPENSRRLFAWDLTGGILLVVVAFLTPFESGFLQESTFSSLWFINMLITTFFALDMVLQFFLPFNKITRGGHIWVANQKKIILHYVRSWFLLDLLSVLPFGYIFAGLSVVRTIRLLRLVKLLRLLRSLRLFRRYQVQIGISQRKLTLYTLFGMVIVISHWIACTLGITSRMQSGEDCTSIGAEGCVTTWLSTAYYNSDVGQYVPPFPGYILALHSAMSILVHPHTYVATGTGERLVFICLMMVGGFIWTQVISRSTAICTSLNQHNIAYQQAMDDLNMLSARFHLPHELRLRLRKYFLRVKDHSEVKTWQSLVTRMSPQLRRDASREVNLHWLRRVKFLVKADPVLITDISQALNLSMYAEQEHFGELHHLYILVQGSGTLSRERGHKKVDFRVLSIGTVWGEDHLLLDCVDLLEDNVAVALTIVMVNSLSREDFERAVAKNPAQAAAIRQVAVKYAVIAGVKSLARRLNEGEEIWPLLSGGKNEGLGVSRGAPDKPKSLDLDTHVLDSKKNAQMTSSRQREKLRASSKTQLTAEPDGPKSKSSVEMLDAASFREGDLFATGEGSKSNTPIPSEKVRMMSRHSEEECGSSEELSLIRRRQADMDMRLGRMEKDIQHVMAGLTKVLSILGAGGLPSAAESEGSQHPLRTGTPGSGVEDRQFAL